LMYPGVWARLGFAADPDLMPLAGISHRFTVFCNETGNYVDYISDEHGFRNPEGSWHQGVPKLAVVGDSFAQGACLKEQNTFVAMLRQHYPSTLNLGITGNGPLLDLAILEEYLPTLKPKTVLWFFFADNDFLDLREEKSSAFLGRYLDLRFQQHLLDRQPEIDRKLTSFLSKAEASPHEFSDLLEQVYLNKRSTYALLYFFLLSDIRFLISHPPPTDHPEFALFQTVMQKADKTVASWGGKLYFVYLPGYVSLETRSSRLQSERERVLQIVTDLGIPLIDVEPEFRQHRTSDLFFSPVSHYNEKGNEIVADTVLRVLSASPR
jgi:hypothetical protein